MRKLLLAAAALGGLTAMTTVGALAAPSAAGVYVMPLQPSVTHVDYWNHHHRWHHRHYDHGRWHYWN